MVLVGGGITPPDENTTNTGALDRIGRPSLARNVQAASDHGMIE
jgi:hypothetical protein